ncbi:hypothetical protein TGCAST_204880 [Toxoplasma gondii CAST]|uniref:Uncharacterized protein n=1 Tax=Toxoplasma gondii CAST TaxID=943122 RepID=A0A3R8AFA0_TOXGO|nr:hypothetical protein TGCAST_204880 [Toxoplasma gondii CAST]
MSCFAPGALCGCCCELCRPVRCVIDQHEVEIIPATYRSSSSVSSVTHGLDGSDAGSLPSTYRSSCARSSHRSQTDDAPTSRSTAVSSHGHRTASHGGYRRRDSPDHPRMQRGGKAAAHAERKLRGGSGTVKIGHFSPNAFPHGHIASSTDHHAASKDLLGRNKPFLLFEDTPKHAASLPSPSPLTVEQLHRKPADQAKDPLVRHQPIGPSQDEGTVKRSDWKICSGSKDASFPASHTSDRLPRMQVVPSLNLQMLYQRRAGLATQSGTAAANGPFLSGPSRGDAADDLKDDSGAPSVVPREVSPAAEVLIRASRPGQISLSTAVATPSTVAKEETLSLGRDQGGQTADRLGSTCVDPEAEGTDCFRPHSVLTPDSNQSRMTSTMLASSRLVPVSRSARRTMVVHPEVSSGHRSSHGGRSEDVSTKISISQHTPRKYSPVSSGRVVGELASAEKNGEAHMPKEEMTDRSAVFVPKYSGATGMIEQSAAEHIERLDRQHDTFSQASQREHSSCQLFNQQRTLPINEHCGSVLHRLHPVEEQPDVAGLSGQSLSRRFSRTVSVSSDSLESSQSMSSRRSTSVCSSLGLRFEELSLRGSFSSRSSILSRGAFSLIAESGDAVGQPQTSLWRSSQAATGNLDPSLPRITHERLSPLLECGSSVQVLQHLEREHAPGIAVLRSRLAPASAATAHRRFVLQSSAPAVPLITRSEKKLIDLQHERKPGVLSTGGRRTSRSRRDSRRSSSPPPLLRTPTKTAAAGDSESNLKAATAVAARVGGDVRYASARAGFRRHCSDMETPIILSDTERDGAVSDDQRPQMDSVFQSFLPQRLRKQRVGSVASARKPTSSRGKTPAPSEADVPTQKSKNTREPGPTLDGAQLSAGARLVFWTSSRSQCDGRAS